MLFGNYGTLKSLCLIDRYMRVADKSTVQLANKKNNKNNILRLYVHVFVAFCQHMPYLF